MKNKGNVLNSLLIMLAGLGHSPAQAHQKHGAQDSVFDLSYAQNQTNVPKDNIKSDSVTSYWPGDTVLQIKRGSNGTILIASIRGVFRYDGKSFINLTSKLGSHRFSDALEDRKGVLWLATNDSGVYYYNGKSLPTAPSLKLQRSKAGQAGLPTSQADLPTGQEGFQHFTTREGLANNRVTCIYEDKAGIIWFGTGVGVSRYDGKLLPTTPSLELQRSKAGQAGFRNFKMKGEDWFFNFITTFMEDRTGRLWISARGDIYIYDDHLPDGQGKQFIALTNKEDKVYDVFSIIEDRKGNIWFGGWDGVRRYDGKTFTKFAYNKGYNFIIEDKKGNIWTSGRISASAWALSRYNEKSLNNKNPTGTEIMSGPAGTFSGILEADDGSIWFGNNGGLYRYDGKTITDFRSKEGNN